MLTFPNLVGLGFVGIIVIGFLTIMGGMSWPTLFAWLFLTWLAIQYNK